MILGYGVQTPCRLTAMPFSGLFFRVRLYFTIIWHVFAPYRLVILILGIRRRRKSTPKAVTSLRCVRYIYITDTIQQTSNHKGYGRVLTETCNGDVITSKGLTKNEQE